MRPGPSKVTDIRFAKPYCDCFSRRRPMPWREQLQEFERATDCPCGEEVGGLDEWRWQQPEGNVESSVELTNNDTQVTFHPTYSSGTAAVRGDSAFDKDHHHYFEVKMLTDTYGTDIMVGVGSDKVNIAESRFKFTSLLGEDEQSYGLSYRGTVRHGAALAHESAGFCRGSIVGVRVDMWQGTLEFYVNRRPQGTSFFNLRRHQRLYPMMSSTAAQSKMRLIYSASWRASLLVDAAKTLAASATGEGVAMMPPGLWRMLKPNFWMFMPTEDPVTKKSEEPAEMELDKAEISDSLFDALLPSRYMNGIYLDSIAPGYQLVLWEDTGVVN